MKIIRLTLIAVLLLTAFFSISHPATAKALGSVNKKPTLSPDGKWIAVLSEINVGFWLHIVSTDGKTDKMLGQSVGKDSDLVWSPDSEKVGISDHGHPQPNLAIINIATAEESDLPANGYIWGFSPDSSNVYISFGESKDITVTNLDWQIQWIWPNTYNPQYSPNAERVMVIPATKMNNIIVTPSNDSKNVIANLAFTGAVVNYKWSPDGTRVAAVVIDSDQNFWLESYENANEVLPDSGRKFTIVSKDLPWYDFDWSPDSRKLVYMQKQGQDQSTVAIFDWWDGVDGKTTILDVPYASHPFFSHDGSKIFFISYRTGNDLLYVMDSDGKNQHLLIP